jgi:hypothetical protein
MKHPVSLLSVVDHRKRKLVLIFLTFRCGACYSAGHTTGGSSVVCENVLAKYILTAFVVDRNNIYNVRLRGVHRHPLPGNGIADPGGYGKLLIGNRVVLAKIASCLSMLPVSTLRVMTIFCACGSRRSATATNGKEPAVTSNPDFLIKSRRDSIWWWVRFVR